MRLVVAAESGSCADANNATEVEPAFHHYVENSSGEKVAKSAAFKYKSSFHVGVLCWLSNARREITSA